MEVKTISSIKPGLISSILKFRSSTLFLLIANLVTIIIAIQQQWSIGNIIWIYFFQNVFIGIFHFVKILNLKNFTTENFKINDQPAEPTPKTKNFTAFFFLFHYGFFHFVYLIFLIVQFGISTLASWAILLSISIFFANHTLSFIKICCSVPISPQHLQQGLCQTV